MQSTSRQGGARGRAVRAATAAAISALLAACTSTGGGSPSSVSMAVASGSPAQAETGKPPLHAPDFPQGAASSYCPPVNIRAGTEAMSLYDKGHDADPEYVRFLGSIAKTARECHQ